MQIKTSTYTRLVNLSLILIVFQGCAFFHDEGEWKSEERMLVPFSQIDLLAVANVYYHYSDSSFVEISYYSKHLSDVKTKIDNKVLIIENEFDGLIYTDYRIPQIDVYTPYFSEINIKEAGSFTCVDTLSVSYFTFRVVGDLAEANLLINSQTFVVSIESATGLVNIKGRSPTLRLYNRGETKINAIDVETHNVEVRQQSYQDIWIRTNGTLSYEIFRSGSIYLVGNPTIEGESLGSGKLIRYE